MAISPSGRPASSDLPTKDAENPPEVPDHELIRIIGQGSYGTVWLARNIMGTYRAVKVVYRSSFDNDRPYDREFHGIQKFEPISRSHESQVDILHIGRNDAKGYFFYVMELADDACSGQPTAPVQPSRFPAHDLHSKRSSLHSPLSNVGSLSAIKLLDFKDYSPRTLKSALADSELGRLSVPDCVDVGIALAQALHHLHSHGLVHRDVKPSNIVFVHGIPKLADIGLVIGVDATLSQVGTEGFAAPEGTGTPQSDIYSLGKVLYEISTGKDRQAFPEPLTDLGACPDRQQLLELDEILARACARDPEARYPSALAMQEDLLLLKTGHSVKRLHQIQRRLAAAVRVGVFAGCLLILVGAGWFYAARKEREALVAQQESEHSRLAEERARQAAEVARQQSLQAIDTLSQMQMMRAEEVLQEGKPLDALAFLAHVVRLTPTNRIATARLTSLLMHRNWAVPSLPPLEHEARVTFATFSPDGRYIASSSADGKAYIWHAANGKRIAGPLTHEKEINEVRFSPNGQLVVTISEDHTARLWESGTGRPIGEPLRHQATVEMAQFSANGQRLVSAAHDGTVTVWSIPNGHALVSIRHQGKVNSAEFSPSGELIGTAGEDRIGCLWNSRSGVLVHALPHPKRVMMLRFSPNGDRVASACSDGGARIWDAVSGALSAPVLKHSDSVTHVEFSPDGQRLVTASKDGTAVVWDVVSGQALSKPMKHRLWVRSALFSRDGLRIVTTSMDGTMRVWDGTSGEPLIEEVSLGANGFCGEFHPDGRRVLTASSGPDVRLWDVALSTSVGMVLNHGDAISGFCLSPDGSLAASCSSTPAQSVRVWNLSSTGLLREWPLSVGNVSYAEFDSQARRLALAGDTGHAEVLDLENPDRILLIGPHPGVIHKAHFSSDGSYLVTFVKGKSAQVWSTSDGRLVNDILQKEGGVLDVKFSPHGGTLVTASQDGFARGWEVTNGTVSSFEVPHRGVVRSVVFSHDGDSFITGSADKTLRRWDARTGKALSPAKLIPEVPHQLWMDPADDELVMVDLGSGIQRLWSLRYKQGPSPGLPLGVNFGRVFDSRGTRFLSGDDHKGIMVRDVRSAGIICQVPALDGTIRSACLGPKGNFLAAVHREAAVRLWEIEDSTSPADPMLPRLAEAIAGQRIDEHGTLVPVLRTVFKELEDTVRARLVVGSSHMSSAGGGVGGSMDSEDGPNSSSTGSNTTYSGFVQWFLSDRMTRAASPMSPIGVSNLVVELSNQADLQATREAVLRDPTNAYAMECYIQSRIQSAGRDRRRLEEVGFLSRFPIEWAPERWQAWYLRSQVAALTGDFVDAAVAMGKAVRLGNETPMLLAEEALLLHLAGKSQEAEAVHRHALDGTTASPLVWEVHHPGLFGSVVAKRDLWPLREHNGRWLIRPAGPRPTLGVPLGNRILGDYYNEWEIRLLGKTNPGQLVLKWNLAYHGGVVSCAVSNQFRSDSGHLWTCTVDLADHPGWRNHQIHSVELTLLGTGTNQDAVLEIDKISLRQQSGSPRPYADIVPSLARESVKRLLDANPLLVGVLRSGKVPIHGEEELKARSPTTSSRLIDLTAHYNASLARHWQTYLDLDAAFPKLPQGEVRLGGVVFDVRGVVQLSSLSQRTHVPGYPQRVEGVGIGHSARRIHFLHAAGWKSASGSHIGDYVLHYADGRTQTVPLRYGEHLRHYSSGGDAESAVSAATVVWSEMNRDGENMRLFKLTLENPTPNVVIQSMDFLSAMTDVAPFLVAVTTEE